MRYNRDGIKHQINGGNVNFTEAIREASATSGKPLTHIGPELGKRPNYVSVYLNKGRDPSTATAAAMLAPCGYALAAVPVADLPASALVIDPPRSD